jgi:glycine oxidase
MNFDCLILGAGIVGLSIADELARSGLTVGVLSRHESAPSSSWAGAGMLTPPPRSSKHPLDTIHRLSFDHWPLWSERLLEETGIGNGFKICGALYLGRTLGEKAALQGMVDHCQAEQIRYELLDAQKLADLEPSLAAVSSRETTISGVMLPDEAQVRNPRHLHALRASLHQKGVPLFQVDQPIKIQQNHNRITSIDSKSEKFSAGCYCIAAGAWSHQLLIGLGIPIEVFPMRGQMLLFETREVSLHRIVNEGTRYLVPRGEGLILAGSTEEEVGFDESVTNPAKLELLSFAHSWLPELTEDRISRHWSGLRPATFDGLPYIGATQRYNNLFVATGHFRAGITLSIGTAIVLGRAIRGEPLDVELRPLSPERGL